MLKNPQLLQLWIFFITFAEHSVDKGQYYLCSIDKIIFKNYCWNEVNILFLYYNYKFKNKCIIQAILYFEIVY